MRYKMPKPKILNNRKMIEIYLSGETKQELTQLAKSKGLCVSTLVRSQITKMLCEEKQNGTFEQT